ncbi:MAG: epoxyqueuosine reductase QueH [Clostridiales bacterium]|nr:epoxyqueuosine reductase QueH [Clostridiales bacterium]
MESLNKGVQRINYQKRMEELIAEHCSDGNVPRLLLHSCCAPCSSYCLMVLSEYFEVTVLYYNPNIYPEEEYRMRAREQERFIRELPTRHEVHFLEGEYDTARFYECVKGLEEEPEGGSRCTVCYELRLREAASYAARGGYEFFTTTLSISPMKDAVRLNTIGGRLAEEYGVAYLYSDFKKKDGYRKSTEISREYGMYRQNYCGCVFSLRERRL